MTNPVSTYIDQATGIEVKVYPSESVPTLKKRSARKYTTMKEKADENAKKGIRMSCANAYDAAVKFGTQLEEATERPDNVSRHTADDDFYSALRQQRAIFNRNKRY